MEKARPSAEPLLVHDTERALAETVTVGASILTMLHGQRRQLEGARERQQDAVYEIDAASGVIQRIWKRLLMRRAMYLGVALLLLVAIGFVLWWKAQPNSSSSSRD